MINAKQQEKLLKMKTLNEVRIKCHVPGANRKIRGGCEVQKKAKEVQRYKVQNKVSYAEATEKVSLKLSQVAA
ncbi:hypothetical protein F7725_026239, partial [Dissostichus mawsoni]